MKYMVEDMKSKLDECQFANQANQSINHYLIQLVDRVLKALDGSTKGEHTVVLCTLVDFSKAFDRQDPTPAIQSFQNNGVRSCPQCRCDVNTRSNVSQGFCQQIRLAHICTESDQLKTKSNPGKFLRKSSFSDF